MVFFNYSTMQMAAKVVYYGPGLCGKTTNLQWIFENTATDSRGEMVSLATETDRTLFFDLLPIDVGSIAGFSTRIQLYTVPGQVFYNTTRKLVLKGVDGVVFVADSQRPMLQANVESFQNLEENLAEMGLSLDNIPLVLQYNKRDLPNICDVAELDQALNRQGWSSVEAAAIDGRGVFETLKLISKKTLLALKKRLTKGRPESSAASASARSAAPAAARPAAPARPAPAAPARPPAVARAPEEPPQPSGAVDPTPEPAAVDSAPAPAAEPAPESPPAEAQSEPAPVEPAAESVAAEPAAESPPAESAPESTAAEPAPESKTAEPAPESATAESAPAAESTEPELDLDDASEAPTEAIPDPGLALERASAAVRALQENEPESPSPATEKAEAPAAESRPPAAAPPKAQRKKRRAADFDALAELEKLRQETIRPAKGAAIVNGKGELRRDFRLALERDNFRRGQRFAVILRLEDEERRVVEEAEPLHVEIEDAAALRRLLLRLDVDLGSAG